MSPASPNFEKLKNFAGSLETEFNRNPNKLDIRGLGNEIDDFLKKTNIRPDYRSEVISDLRSVPLNLQKLEAGKRVSTIEQKIAGPRRELAEQLAEKDAESPEHSFVDSTLDLMKDMSNDINSGGTADSVRLQDGIRNQVASLLNASAEKGSNRAKIPDIWGGAVDIKISSSTIGENIENVRDLMSIVSGRKNENGEYFDDFTAGVMLKFKRDESLSADEDIESISLSPDGRIKLNRHSDLGTTKSLLIIPSSLLDKISDPEKKEKVANLNNGSEKIFLEMFIKKMDRVLTKRDAEVVGQIEESIKQARVDRLLDELDSVNGPKYENYSFGEILKAQRELLDKIDTIKKDPVSYIDQKREKRKGQSIEKMDNAA